MRVPNAPFIGILIRDLQLVGVAGDGNNLNLGNPIDSSYLVKVLETALP